MNAATVLLVAAAVILPVDCLRWYRRPINGVRRRMSGALILGILIVWPAIVAVRAGRWVVGNWWEWSAGPRVAHARHRWANRTVLRRRPPASPPAPIYTAGAVLAQAGIDHTKATPTAPAASPAGAVLIAPHGVTEDGRLLYEAVN